MKPRLQSACDNQDVQRNDWAPLLETAAREVFEIMLGTPLERVPDEELPLVTELTAMIGLAGQLRGVLAIHTGAETAARITSKMLGIDVSTVNSDVRDALGEICNMVAGNFKTKLSPLIPDCMISLPTVITGEDYFLYTVAGNERRSELTFDFAGSRLWVVLDLTE